MCVCVYIHIHVSSKCRNVGQGKEITETVTAMNSMCQEKSFYMHTCHRFASPALGYTEDIESNPMD